MNHSDLGVGQLHGIFNWYWTNSTDRLSTSVTADDVGKVGIQEDTGAVYFLQNISTWTRIGATSLADMSDVDTTGVLTDYILIYDGTEWVVQLNSIGGISDVDLTGVGNGDTLIYNTGTWEAGTPALSNLSDVDITGIADGNVLVYNAGTWEAGTGGGGGGVSQFTATIYASADWNDEAIPIWQAPKDTGVTISQVNASVMGATTPSLLFNLNKRAYNTLSVAGTNIFASDQSATLTGLETTTFSVDTMSAKDYLVLTTPATGAETGVVFLIVITVYFEVI
jgi:hypothetical protein